MRGARLLPLTAVVAALLLNGCVQLFVHDGREGTWEVEEGSRIILHYRPADYSRLPSPTPDTAAAIVAEQEAAYAAILQRLEASFSGQVHLYLYNRDEAEEVIGTSGGGHAIGEFQAIYYTYFPVERARLYRGPGGSEPYFIGLHELTHVISHQTLGKPGTRLLAEGLAVALDGGYGVRPAPERPPGTYLQVTVERWVNENLASLLGPRELFDRQERLDEALFYPQAGAFVRFLLERPGGLEAVKALFTAPEAEFPAAFLRAAGTSLEGVRGEYLAWCASLDP